MWLHLLCCTQCWHHNCFITNNVIFSKCRMYLRPFRSPILTLIHHTWRESSPKLLTFLWPFRFLIQQRCEPEARGGGSGAEHASARRYRRPGRCCAWRPNQTLLHLWARGGPAAHEEMHLLHLQRQGVCVLLPPGHHLDQHTRVRVILHTPSSRFNMAAVLRCSFTSQCIFCEWCVDRFWYITTSDFKHLCSS